jgi:tetratricopeptide (TPR) repeat protein
MFAFIKNLYKAKTMIKNIVNNSQNLLRNWIIVTILLLTACAVQHPGPACFKDKIQYGQVEGAFRSRWWNFYERGRSYLEGECLDAAISDFKAAIEQNDQDQRMVRTYGLHFVDYFPHRELGLIHYLLGDLDAAKSELEKSLSQESTSKAHHYLDEVRKKQLKPPLLSFIFLIKTPFGHLMNVFVFEEWPVMNSIFQIFRLMDTHMIFKERQNRSLFRLK